MGKIEWCDKTINPVKGKCPVACSYCYARRMYDRFKWNPEIRWDSVGYLKNDWGIATLKKPSKIFVGSTMELFGEWVTRMMRQTIFQVTRRYPQHTFIFLTKRPDRLAEWSPFPENCWVGVSCTNDVDFTNRAWKYLKNVKATVKFVSFEPLLGWRMSVDDTRFTLESAGINWVIIGQQTPASVKTAPEMDWIRNIVLAADKINVPVFLKDNLVLPPEDWAIRQNEHGQFWPRQEFPKIEVKV